MVDQLQSAIDSYLETRWDEVIADIDALVSIESVEDLDAAREGAPFGPGPRKALDTALSIAQRMELDVRDCEGFIGYADLPGESASQIGIIGHVDVVPAGPGWSFPPYKVTRRDGYLMGRGIFDDKGPTIVALHAVNFWRERLANQKRRFPYTTRVLFGANEETNMKDVAYYRERFADPLFLFTPDAEFPVCYGEAGICSGTLVSAPIADGTLRDIKAGVAVNAVPGLASAVLETGCPHDITATRAGVDVEQDGARITIEAHGKSAHASTPELGESAIDILVSYLLDEHVLSPEEQRFLRLVHAITAHVDGSGIGLSAEDKHFGRLTVVGGVLSLRDSRICLSLDFRYPTTIDADEIEKCVNAAAAEAGAAFTMEHDKTPFLMDPSSPAVQALLAAYNEATGENAEPFTMKGGTYARVFTTAASFGPEKPWEEKPSWVGSMHGPDEGVREDLLKQAFSIYVRTIEKLMNSLKPKQPT